MNRICQIGGALLGLSALTSQVYALSFGSFDARAMSMGGAGVAVPNLATGQFYNPALLALHSGDEDKTGEGRHTLPMVSAQYSDAAKIAWQAVHDDLEGELSAAVQAYNENPGAATAQAGEAAARNLEEAMSGVRGEPILADLFVGYSVTEPGHKEGGAFFIGSRGVGGGEAIIDQDDLELLEDYIEALEFVRTAGVSGAAHPQLFNESGRLIDPEEDIISRARGQVGVITEIGVSAARVKKWRGQVFSFGVSPKAVNVRLYDDEWLFNDGEYQSTADNEQAFWRFNADLGAIWAPRESLLVGLTVKDIVPMSRVSEFGYEFRLEPRSRLGISYTQDKWLVGLDLDLYANRAFLAGERQHEVSVGVQYAAFKQLKLRAGYRADLNGNFGDALTLGAGFSWSFLSLDLAFAAGSDDHQAALQLGFAH